MFGEFVASYIKKCIEEGVCGPADILARAEREICNIDQEINKIDNLRSRQNKLRAVVKHMGGDVNTNKPTESNIDFSTPWDSLESSYKVWCVAIVEYVNKHNEKKPREIMEGVASYSEQKVVYSAIKWLHNHGVIARNELDRKIIRGSKWDSFAKYSTA